MSQNHVTEYFHMAKERAVQWQLNGNYRLTCTPGRIAAHLISMVTALQRQLTCTAVLRRFVSKITVEITAFLLCSLMEESEYIYGGRFVFFFYGGQHQT